MKRQAYYPKRVASQVLWLTNCGNKAVSVATALGLDTAAAADRAADAKWLAYTLGAFRENVRAYAETVTQYLIIAQRGITGGSTWPTPAFVNTTPPAGTNAVGAGALERIFRFVQEVKNAPGYNTTLGEELQIIGPPVTNGQPSPTFVLKLGDGPDCECVGINFRKFTHEGVVIESRRAGEQEFSFLANSIGRRYTDNRALLVPGQPEVRAYRLRFWDKGVETGVWSEAGSITVGP